MTGRHRPGRHRPERVASHTHRAYVVLTVGERRIHYCPCGAAW